MILGILAALLALIYFDEMLYLGWLLIVFATSLVFMSAMWAFIYVLLGLLWEIIT